MQKIGAIAIAAIVLVCGFAAPQKSHADLGAEPQRFEYQLWSCRETPEQGDGAWFCRNEGRGVDTAFQTLAACQEARDNNPPASAGLWFQCWRRPTWSPAEGRPLASNE